MTTMTLKIAIGPRIATEHTGTQTHVANIIKHSKFELTPITPRFSIYYKKHSTRYVRLLRKYKVERIDPYGLYLSRFVLPKYDIVHLHGHPDWPEMFFHPKNTHAKYIQTVHQIYFKEDYMHDLKVWPVVEYQNERMFRSCRDCDAVISVSAWMQEYLESEKGIESVYIPNGINLEEYKKANSKRFIEKYRIEEEFYLFVGRLEYCKRIELFVELAKKIPDRLFVIVGVQTDKLKAYLNDLIPKNVICLGSLPHKDFIDTLSACKVLLMPSSRETSPIALLEAMICKKPVVATNNTGPAEIISDKVDGFLFELDDIEDFYEKALLAWENPKIGEKGYKKVKNNFHWKTVIKEIDKLYELIVS